ncbi:MAG: hypothetical protein O3A00_06230 [Planctomycetota bacterium]|nr:hypothetical protein [Planctomycetota bacterium]
MNEHHQPEPQPSVSSEPRPARKVHWGVIVVGLAIVGMTGWIIFELNRGWIEEQFQAMSKQELVPVAGKLSFDGKPVADGFVETRLIGKDGKMTLGGLSKIEEDGSFNLVTDIEGKLEIGVYSGTHKMVVRWSETGPGQLAPTWLVPARYIDFASTPIEFEATGTDQINLKLNLEKSD